MRVELGRKTWDAGIIYNTLAPPRYVVNNAAFVSATALHTSVRPSRSPTIGMLFADGASLELIAAGPGAWLISHGIAIVTAALRQKLFVSDVCGVPG